jgi:hypothetical protein
MEIIYINHEISLPLKNARFSIFLNKIVFVDIIINSFKDKINKRNNIDIN